MSELRSAAASRIMQDIVKMFRVPRIKDRLKKKTEDPKKALAPEPDVEVHIEKEIELPEAKVMAPSLAGMVRMQKVQQVRKSNKRSRSKRKK